MKKFTSTTLLVACFVLIGKGQIYHRTDTIFIAEATVLPFIDATLDGAWDMVAWQPIDQVWMPWSNQSSNLNQSQGLQLWQSANDFTGNFKILWSSETNLLYFFVEIIDDIFVDGYAAPAGGYPDYDIVEVFIDEDRSGGNHVFDNTLFTGTGGTTGCPTCNAENAFAYHIAANALADGQIQKTMHVMDMAGITWGTLRDYKDHLPDFAMRKDGNKYYWEFSLLVHKDAYNHNNQAASVQTLQKGKILGLSMAYCDNDSKAENPLRRDHFFGSVPVPNIAHNSHWINADWFGAVKLGDKIDNTSVNVLEPGKNTELSSFYTNGNLYSTYRSENYGLVTIRLVSILGQEIFRASNSKSSVVLNTKYNTGAVPAGVYFVEVVHGNNRTVQKIVVR